MGTGISVARTPTELLFLAIMYAGGQRPSARQPGNRGSVPTNARVDIGDHKWRDMPLASAGDPWDRSADVCLVARADGQWMPTLARDSGQ